MPGFRHILCPIDLSERSKAIVPYVRDFVERFQAKLTVLNAVGIPPVIYGVDPSFPIMFDFPSLEPRLTEQLQEFFNLPAADCIVEQGDPAVVIADYAREHGVDLIMMSTHGYGRFRSLLMGSVVSKVLHDVDCAVWTAPHTDDPHLMEHLPSRNMLVAVDLTPGQDQVIRRAVELAKEFGAQLRLAHAIPGAEHRPGETGGDEFGIFLRRSAREEIERIQSEAGTNLEVSIEPGSVGRTIRKVALEHHADLLVIGRGVMHETLGRLRTETFEIVRESPCPVLSL